MDPQKTRLSERPKAFVLVKRTVEPLWWRQLRPRVTVTASFCVGWTEHPIILRPQDAGGISEPAAAILARWCEWIADDGVRSCGCVASFLGMKSVCLCVSCLLARFLYLLHTD